MRIIQKLFLLPSIFLITIGNVSASDWLQSFYTDDSPYYQRLFTDGFEQRFRIHRNHCYEITNATIITKSSILNNNSSFRALTNLATWPSIYGLNESEFCWFSVRVNGLKLNQVQENKYAIKFETKRGDTLYFQAPTHSILPMNRFSRSIEEWMTPGQMGATPVIGGGVLFKLWEPEAEEVHLYLNDIRKPTMIEDQPIRNPHRVHHLYDPNARIGDRYHFQFVKNGRYEELEVRNDGHRSPVKIDPMAREIIYDKKGGSINAYLNPRAVVADLYPAHYWRHDRNVIEQNALDYQNWILYQLWPLAFNPQKVNNRYQVGTFRDILPALDYLESIGVTAIEFLPVHESRFNASWGYALDSLTLIEKTYGSRQELAHLVDSIHSKKLKVVFDVIINHVNNFLIRDPLTRTQKRTKFFGGDTEWGPKPDFESMMVQKWIADSLLNLARDYHVDGFRFDMIEHVYRDNPAGYKFVQELNTLLKLENPRFYSSAEQLPDNVWATYPLHKNGLAFDSQWNDKFKNFFEMELDHYRPNNLRIDTSPLIGSLIGYSNHRHWSGEYPFGHPLRTVNYLGSHDVVGNKNPILRMVSDFESYESINGNNIYRVRPLEDNFNTLEKFRQIHNNFTHSVGKVGYGILFANPGAALFYQGEEFAQDINIENEWSYVYAREGNSIPTRDVDVHRYVGSHRVPWEYLQTTFSPQLSFLKPEEHHLFTGYHAFIKKMIHFKKSNPELNLQHAQEVRDYGDGIVGFKLQTLKKSFFIIINFGENKQDKWIQFPGTTRDWWRETITSASPEYGNSKGTFQNIIPHLGGRANQVRLEATSFYLFEHSYRPELSKDIFLMSSYSGWTANNNYKLHSVNEAGYLLATEIFLEKDTAFEFKIANADWSIEMGSEVSLKNLLSPAGQLSYSLNRPNAQVHLTSGRYRFIFDIKTFRYHFIAL